MKSSAKLAIMSHLSDAQEMLSMIDDHKFAETISKEINFAKFVFLKCMDDLYEEIDLDELYKEFIEKFPK